MGGNSTVSFVLVRIGGDGGEGGDGGRLLRRLQLVTHLSLSSRMLVEGMGAGKEEEG